MSEEGTVTQVEAVEAQPRPVYPNLASFVRAVVHRPWKGNGEVVNELVAECRELAWVSISSKTLAKKLRQEAARRGVKGESRDHSCVRYRWRREKAA